MLKISNFVELLMYFQQIKIPQMGKLFATTTKCLDENTHGNDELSNVILNMVKRVDQSLVSVISKMCEETYKGMIDCLNKNDSILINKIGGWMPYSGVTLIDEKESDELFWPDIRKKKIEYSEMKITRWPGGRHYYLSIRERELGKFNKPEIAESEGRKFIDKMNSDGGN